MTTKPATIRHDALEGIRYYLTERDPYTVYLWQHEHPRLRWMGRLVEMFYSVRDALRCLPCFIANDHDLEDERHASPDSGCIRMTCRRCGYTYPTYWLVLREEQTMSYRFDIPEGADVVKTFADAIHRQWEEIGPDWIEAYPSVEPFDYETGASVHDVIDNCSGCVEGFLAVVATGRHRSAARDHQARRHPERVVESREKGDTDMNDRLVNTTAERLAQIKSDRALAVEIAALPDDLKSYVVVRLREIERTDVSFSYRWGHIIDRLDSRFDPGDKIRYRGKVALHLVFRRNLLDPGCRAGHVRRLRRALRLHARSRVL